MSTGWSHYCSRPLVILLNFDYQFQYCSYFKQYTVNKRGRWWMLIENVGSSSIIQTVLYVICAGVPPSLFTSQPQSGSPLIPGGTKVLLCTADGSPSLVYRWTKDEQPLSNVPAAAVSAGVLRIRNIAVSDAGTYRCIASNHLGAIRSQPANIHVACE